VDPGGSSRSAAKADSAAGVSELADLDTPQRCEPRKRRRPAGKPRISVQVHPHLTCDPSTARFGTPLRGRQNDEPFVNGPSSRFQQKYLAHVGFPALSILLANSAVNRLAGSWARCGAPRRRSRGFQTPERIRIRPSAMEGPWCSAATWPSLAGRRRLGHRPMPPIPLGPPRERDPAPGEPRSHGVEDRARAVFRDAELELVAEECEVVQLAPVGRDLASADQARGG
jgi:hypothetical protein